MTGELIAEAAEFTGAAAANLCDEGAGAQDPPAPARSGLRETLGNIGWVSLSRLLRMGGSLAVGTAVVRYLGPSRYGVLSYAMAVYGLFNIVSNLGLDVLVVSELALVHDQETEEQVLGTAFWLKAAASLLTTLAAVLYALWAHRDDRTVALLVGLLSVASITQAFDVVDFFFQARTRSRLVALPQIAVFLVCNLARVGAVLCRAPLLAFGAIAAAEILLAELALAAVYARHQRNLWRWRFQAVRARTMLRDSWPLLLASLLVILYMRTDQVLLGALCPPAVVGQYACASRLSEIWYALPTLICASVMPRLLRTRQSHPERYYARLQHTYTLMAGLSIALALLVTLSAKFIILLLFGPAYLPAAAVLRVHIWTGPFVFLGVTSGIQLVHEGLTRISLQRGLAGAVLNIALNCLLIPHGGAVGSAVATLLTQALVSYGLDAANRSTRHIFRMKTRAFAGVGSLWTRNLAIDPRSLLRWRLRTAEEL